MKNKQLQLLMKLSQAFLGLLLALMFSPAGLAQVDQWGAWENGVTESWWLSSKTFTKEEAAVAIDRWKRIGLAGQDNSGKNWSGDYFTGGDTHGTYVRWSPNEGFVIANVDKCQALVMGVTHGRVEATPTLIKFFPEFSKSSKGHGHAHSVDGNSAVMSFVPTRWLDRLFLIPHEQITDFSDYVAGLGDFNGLHGFGPFDLEGSYFFSKYAGTNAEVFDSPVVPSEYERFLKRPIIAKIIAVEGRRLKRNYSHEFKSKILSFTTQHELASLTFVTVNVGTVEGAKNGLLLRVSKPNLGETVLLVDVGKKSSKGVVVRDVEKGKETYYDNETERERTFPRVAMGWRLTTARGR